MSSNIVQYYEPERSLVLDAIKGGVRMLHDFPTVNAELTPGKAAMCLGALAVEGAVNSYAIDGPWRLGSATYTRRLDVETAILQLLGTKHSAAEGIFVALDRWPDTVVAYCIGVLVAQRRILPPIEGQMYYRLCPSGRI